MGKKTAELTGIALDWAVAKCMGHRVAENYGSYIRIYLPDPKQSGYTLAFCPSTNWAEGGPLIEREEIDLGVYRNDCWRASKYVGDSITANGYGPTPLIAAMRCYVVLKLGVAVDIPDELK